MTHANPFLRIVATLAAAACFLHATPAIARAGHHPATATDDAERTDRLIVKYRKGSAADVGGAVPAMAPALLAADGLRIESSRRLRGRHVLRLDRSATLKQLRAVARAVREANPDIDYVEPDRLLQPQAVVNDPYFPLQWDLQPGGGGIGAAAAWDASTGKGVVVAVLDTGIRPHADLAANLLAGYDMISDPAVANDGDGRDPDPADTGDAVGAGECSAANAATPSSWHGTHVAGTIAAVANNGVGIAGVAPGARVLPVRVLGKCGGYVSDIADAITWASGGSVDGVPDNPIPARVINLSLGGPGTCDRTTQAAITEARARGAVVVVAAGNAAMDAAGFTPANCAGVVTVAAVDRRGARAYYSNYGMVVDVAAPGGDMRLAAADGILSALNDGTAAPGADAYAYYQGTSMAAPHVAGIVALMLSANPALTPDEVAARIAASARVAPGVCVQCGRGIVDAAAAVALAAAPGGSADAPVIAEVEPNDLRATANLLASGAVTVQGGLTGLIDEEDWFRVSVAPGAALTATLEPTQDFDLALVDANGATLASSARSGSQVEVVAWRNTGTAALAVYVHVTDYGHASGSYQLRIAQ